MRSQEVRFTSRAEWPGPTPEDIESIKIQALCIKGESFMVYGTNPSEKSSN